MCSPAAHCQRDVASPATRQQACQKKQHVSLTARELLRDPHRVAPGEQEGHPMSGGESRVTLLDTNTKPFGLCQWSERGGVSRETPEAARVEECRAPRRASRPTSGVGGGLSTAARSREKERTKEGTNEGNEFWTSHGRGLAARVGESSFDGSWRRRMGGAAAARRDRGVGHVSLWTHVRRRTRAAPRGGRAACSPRGGSAACAGGGGGAGGHILVIRIPFLLDLGGHTSTRSSDTQTRGPGLDIYRYS